MDGILQAIAHLTAPKKHVKPQADPNILKAVIKHLVDTSAQADSGQDPSAQITPDTRLNTAPQMPQNQFAKGFTSEAGVGVNSGNPFAALGDNFGNNPLMGGAEIKAPFTFAEALGKVMPQATHTLQMLPSGILAGAGGKGIKDAIASLKAPKSTLPTLDEFLQNHTVYHGGDKDFIDNSLAKKQFNPSAKRDAGTGGNFYGLSTSSDPMVAKDFSTSSTGNPGVAELHFDPDARILELKGKALDDLSEAETRKLAKDYDVIRDVDNVGGEKEVRILNPDVLRDKSQIESYHYLLEQGIKTQPKAVQAGLYDTNTPLYHGTTKNFNTFDTKAGEKSNQPIGALGTWFSDNSQNAKNIAGEQGRVIESRVNLKKPKVYESFNDLVNDIEKNGKMWTTKDVNGSMFEQGNNQPVIAFREALKKQGYDGIVVKRPQGAQGAVDDLPDTQFVAFNDKSIASHVAQPPFSDSLKQILPKFEGNQKYTTKVLDKLQGSSQVSPQAIQDLLRMPDVKQGEKDVISSALETYNGQSKIPVAQFGKDVEDKVLPLKRNSLGDDVMNGEDGRRYQNVNLPSELRGNVANYQENIYSSPIKTSAGNTHYPGNVDDYFAHTRVEDLARGGPSVKEADMMNMSGDDLRNYYAKQQEAGDTRRVIELQSDLFQKGRLDIEMKNNNYWYGNLPRAEKDEVMTMQAKGLPELNPIERARFDELHQKGIDIGKAGKPGFDKLKPYENTWHERVIREEVKKAAEDGKTKLQFPTGETAMKVEGLGELEAFQHSDGSLLSADSMKVGESVTSSEVHGNGMENQWIITDVLGDGKFKAVPKNIYESPDAHANGIIPSHTEEFDISGKVDQNNPIYKFYESEVGKYLTKKYGAQRVKDPQGVEWYEIPVDRSHARKPVEAFGVLPFASAIQQMQQGQDEQSQPRM